MDLFSHEGDWEGMTVAVSRAKGRGGKRGPVGGDFAGSSLKVPEGADYVPGLKEAVAGRM